MSYTAAILTCSDAGASGDRKDTSADAIHGHLSSAGYAVNKYLIVPDDKNIITNTLVTWVDQGDIDLIITTGGTGFSDRDITPEATVSVIERHAAGIAELLRSNGLKNTLMAALSRGVAGTRNKTLIINLPGSPKGVNEGMEILLPILPHALGQLTGKNRGH